MSAPHIERLRKMMQDALAQYNAELAGGGEPVFPEWTTDIRAVLDSHDRMVAALDQARTAIKVGVPEYDLGDALEIIEGALVAEAA